MQLSKHNFETILEELNYGAFLFEEGIKSRSDLEIFYVNKKLATMLSIDDPVIRSLPRLYLHSLSDSCFNTYKAFGTLLVKYLDKELFTFYVQELKRTYACLSFTIDSVYRVCLVIDQDQYIKKQSIESSKFIYQQMICAQVEVIQKTQSLLEEYVSRFEKTQTISHIGSWEYDLLHDRIWVSEECKDIFGIDTVEENFFSNQVTRLIHEEDVMDFNEHISSFNQGFNAATSKSYKLIHGKTHELTYIHCSTEPRFNKEGAVITISGLVQDYTDRELYEQMLVNKNESITNLYEELLTKQKELEHQYQETQFHKSKHHLSEEKYRTLVDNSQDIIYSCDTSGTIMAVNQRFCSFYRTDSEQAIGKAMNTFIDNEEVFLEWMNAFLRAVNEEVVVMLEQSYVDNEEAYIYDITYSPIFNERNEIMGITITKHNITSIRKSEEKLEHLTLHDQLTNLPNRTALFDKLDKQIKEISPDMEMALLFIDMDNFKKVNDTLGHQVGDELLKAVSRRIAACLRGKDFIARLSGDEFGILLANIDNASDISLVVHRILKKVNESFNIENHIVEITASIGIACYPADASNAEDLLKCADTAMYQSKDASKNSYRFYNDEMSQELLNKMKYETNLKNAIKDQELRMVYQPQFTHNNILRGFEALIRWENRVLGNVPPDEFIPIAEETGIIHEIGEWVADTAMKKCKDWQERFGYKGIMAINISPIQLQRESFVEVLTVGMQHYQLANQDIELEITESLFIDNYDMAINVLDGLKESGFRIALDDFGTGYSSLSYLKRLPINLLKIDKSFIKEIDVTNPSGDITESIISLVHKLNIETIAEGVETAEQMDYLVKAKCDNLQGYHLGRPLEEIEADALVAGYIKNK